MPRTKVRLRELDIDFNPDCDSGEEVHLGDTGQVRFVSTRPCTLLFAVSKDDNDKPIGGLIFGKKRLVLKKGANTPRKIVRPGRNECTVEGEAPDPQVLESP